MYIALYSRCVDNKKAKHFKFHTPRIQIEHKHIRRDRVRKRE